MFEWIEKLKNIKWINEKPVMRIGTHKKPVVVLWIVLIISLCFGVYKNFTAVDTHTVYKEKIIDKQVKDTNDIENFVRNFARAYYSWNNNQESIDQRTVTINNYVTKRLQEINIDTVRMDIPTNAIVDDIQIWGITQEQEKEYQVTFTVNQTIQEGEETRRVSASYLTTVYKNDNGDMVIIQNPTITNLPGKASYEPKAKEGDSTIDAYMTAEATAFLETFFRLYPSATEQELSYYIKKSVLKPINNNYLFAELINPVYTKVGKDLRVKLFVKYLDQQTQTVQISEFDLTLAKKGNWMIIK